MGDALILTTFNLDTDDGSGLWGPDFGNDTSSACTNSPTTLESMADGEMTGGEHDGEHGYASEGISYTGGKFLLGFKK